MKDGRLMLAWGVIAAWSVWGDPAAAQPIGTDSVSASFAQEMGTSSGTAQPTAERTPAPPPPVPQTSAPQAPPEAPPGTPTTAEGSPPVGWPPAPSSSTMPMVGAPPPSQVPAASTASVPYPRIQFEASPADAASQGTSEGAPKPDHQLVGLVAFGVGTIREPNIDLLALLGTDSSDSTDTNSDDGTFVPTLDGRFWVGKDKRWGLDVGLSYIDVNVRVDGNKTQHAGGFYSRVGVPIALTSARHMTIELIPQLSYLGLGTSNTDVSFALYEWDLAVRLSAEIHFGFMGLPELALQSGLGMTYSHQVVRTRLRTVGFFPGETDGVQRQRALATVIGPTGGRGPWEMFVGNLAALYYF